MKNSKNIKILISMLILIFATLMSTKVSAYEYDVFKEDVPNHLSGGRYKPHMEGSFWMYCRQSGGAYKNVTLSKTTYNEWAAKGFRTPAEGSEYDHNNTAATPPWTGFRTTMHYTQGAKIEETQDEYTYQEAAYILATALERGQLASMDTAHSIWAAEINVGSKERPGNALYQEANAYVAFYKKLQRKSFEERVKDNTHYTDTNPAVLVNQDNGTYTIGKFKVGYLTGDYNFTANQEGSDDIVENEEVIINLFKKAVENANRVHTSRYEDGEKKYEFMAAKDTAKALLQTYNASPSSVTWKEMQTTRKDLIKAQKALVLKPGETDDRKYENEPEETTTSVTKDGKFSYIKSIEVIGLDANNREVSNSISDKQVINQQGNKLWDVDKQGNQINVPKSNEEFYVNFKVTNASVKKIKLKVTFEWLDSCYAEAYEFNGVERKWEWNVKYTSEVCHTDYTTCSALGHTTSRCPNNTPDKHNPTNRYKWYYKLEYSDGDSRQKLLGLEGERASKNWNTCELMLNNDQPIDITMELGGYVFLDSDQGKVNTGDNILNTDDKGNITETVIPGAEVWLYEKGTNNPPRVTITDKDGHYKFTQLNAMKKYYVKFVYNGMLYTNVAYNIGNPEYNTEAWKATSKATENSGERTTFNDKFKEIGSYPSNYKTKSIFDGSEIYNTTYKQEDIVDIFKALTNQIVKDKDVKTACNNLIRGKENDLEYKCKLQFAVDCRISAYTNGDTGRESAKAVNKNYEYYPIYNKFTISTQAKTIGNVTYKPIYEGQKYINLGIKGRPTFDLYLSKDVLNAQVSINGQTETYKYNYTLHRIGYYDKYGFPIGINEDAYLEIMRTKYTPVKMDQIRLGDDNKTFNETYGTGADSQYTSNQTNGYKENMEYELYMRPEEVAEGRLDSEEGKEGYRGNTGVNTTGENAYVESDNPTNLDVKITYKIEITNESSVRGGPTEIVDYYDTKYTLVDAYIGNDDGTKRTSNIAWSETSRYNERPDIYKKADNKYKTVYLPLGDNISLTNNGKLYIYVTLQLKDASKTLIDSGLLQDEGKLESINVAEINGYKTYNKDNEQYSLGLIDKDSTPGNLNISGIREFNKDYVDSVGLEDDSKRAPAFIYRKRQSKTIEGVVFEDKTSDTLQTKQVREGNGQYDSGDTPIGGVIVELVRESDSQPVAKTTTDSNGWYGFTGFVAGNYKVRFTYGHNDDTAMAIDSKIGQKAENDNDTTRHPGLNNKSYNGQDFQSTIYPQRDYTGYWYDENNANATRYSDAEDTEARKKAVIDYSNERDEQGNVTTAIRNYKAEVFNSYKNDDYYKEHYPNEYLKIDDKLLGELQYELKDKTYRQAETPTITVEVEQAKTEVDGNNKTKDYYKHEISNIDFGIAERPRSELIIDQDVKHIKVTAADGTVLFNAEAGETNNNSNLQWIKGKDYTEEKFAQRWIQMVWGNKKLTKEEKINIIMDDELISNSTLEITYNITVTNTGEKDGDATTRAKNIINYVANNLTFDNTDATNIKNWEIAKVDEIQKDDNTTLINSRNKGDYDKGIDLSTQTTILKATENNPLTKTSLKPGDSANTTLKLSKVINAASASDDLKYTNMTEIVEIENTVGRYDHGAIPGNQDLKKNPTEHDTSGASSEAAINDEGFTPPDGEVVITPPTGSTMIYYAIGITATVILAAGIYLIKKFVIGNK